MKMTPYFMNDSIYPICIYLSKNWKSHNLNDVNKRRYDSNLNSRKVILDNVLGSLKNKWWILKFFNVVVCCVLHNYCEMWKIPKLGHLNDVIRRDNLARFKVDGDKKQAKRARELMKIALFEQWLIDHLRRIWFFTLYLEHGLK
jgi:hypothetical protein